MPQVSLANGLTAWTGKQYVELPADLCQGYTDHLWGQRGTQKYGGVICDRPEGAYIFLQRLINYTPAQKAIWEIVQIQALTPLQPDESAVMAGCRHLDDADKPVVAIVTLQAEDTYSTLRAWEINLAAETFMDIEPGKVQCREPLSPTLAGE